MRPFRIVGVLVTAIVVATMLAVVGPVHEALAQVGVAVKNGFATCVGTNCDNTLTVGGTLSVASTATVTGLVTGPSNATYKIARGTFTLDGSNPTTVASGLTTLVACDAHLTAAAIPGDDPLGVTPNISGTNLNLYAWGTNGTDPTPVASTNSAVTGYWICVGT